VGEGGGGKLPPRRKERKERREREREGERERWWERGKYIHAYMYIFGAMLQVISNPLRL
jgi:hypothetical protein